ncbi:hypothetical protein L0337_10270, partial [candidate division KSB1 bacterium]|nr:hypothetical protein [candidate division KSB1 bacterium]
RHGDSRYGSKGRPDECLNRTLVGLNCVGIILQKWVLFCLNRTLVGLNQRHFCAVLCAKTASESNPRWVETELELFYKNGINFV